MRLKIYQRKHESKHSFVSYDESVKHGISPSDYRCVFNGHLEANSLSDVFHRCNDGCPPSYQGRSMSVGDIVEVMGDVPKLCGRIDFYFRDTDGVGKVGDTAFYTDERKFRKEVEECRYYGSPIKETVLADKNIPAVQNGIYFCDTEDFKKLDDFDTSKCAEMEGIRVLMMEPGRPPVETRIKNNLRDLQNAVSKNGEDALIEITYPFSKDNAVVLSNEEAKLIGMRGNRYICGAVYAGPLYIVGDKYGELCDLTDKQIERYGKAFEKPDIISQSEVEADTGFMIYGF